MATIIKATGMSREAADAQPVAFNLGDVAANAESYLDTVRTQATLIIQKARQEAEQIKRKAESEGSKTAVAAAERSLRTSFDPQMKSLSGALQAASSQLLEAQQAWLAQWEKNALRVVLAIASRVVRREMKRQPVITLDLVREALELASGCARVRLHLNPADLAALGNDVNKVVNSLARLAPAEIVSDETVSAGGCRVTTEFGSIDNTLEAQMARLEQELG